MDNKRNWGGARKGAGAPVTVKPNDKRKQRAISLSDTEYKELKTHSRYKRNVYISINKRSL